MKIEGLENKTLEEWIIIDKTSKKEFNENINFEKNTKFINFTLFIQLYRYLSNLSK